VPNDALAMPDAALAPVATRLGFLFDDALAETPLRTLQALMQQTLATLTADKRVALDRYEMAITASHHGLVNSHGVRQEERQTAAHWTFFGMARDGDEVSGFDYVSDFAFAAAGLEGKSKVGAEKFAHAIVAQLKPRQAPTYKGPVLLTPRAVEELLVGMALYHAGGRNVMDGKSRWAESIGKPVLSPLVSLVDRPHDARFSGASSFDADGLPTAQRALVDKGVLTLHLHDCESAKRCKTKPNGMAGGPFALTVEPGRTPRATLGDARKELLVVDRFSGNTDPVKGDFSGVAKSSRLLVAGQDAGAVTETMIAGNFFELADAVLAVSAETESVGGSMLAPWILIDNVSVTGG
jgi:PmbA protein